MKQLNRPFLRYLSAVLFLTLCHGLHARQAIDVSLSGAARSQSFSNLEDAINSLLEDPSTTYGGSFSLGDNYTGVITIFGFNMSLDFSESAITYTFLDKDGTPVSRTFNGVSRADSLGQLDDFFQSDVAKADFEKYMQAMQTQSNFNFISGAESTVGQSVRDNTMRAMGRSMTTGEKRLMARDGGRFAIGFDYSDFTSGNYTGESYTVPIEFGGKLGNKADLLFRLPLGYTDIDGTEIYRLGMELDLGIKLYGHAPGSPLTWEVTPTAGNYIMGTTDLYIGGDIYNYGLQNRFEANMGQYSLSYGLYYGKYESTELSLNDIDIDLGVDTTVISNGLKIIYRLGSFVLFDLYAINSRPEDGFGYEEVETLGGSINFRSNAMALRIGYSEEKGKDTRNEDYEAERITATLTLRF